MRIVFVKIGVVVALAGCGGGESSVEAELVILNIGGGSVAVTPSGTVQLDCGATCRGTYEAGANVHLVATPGVGQTFVGWSGACSGTTDCDIAVWNSVVVEAHFGPPTSSWGIATDHRFPMSATSAVDRLVTAGSRLFSPAPGGENVFIWGRDPSGAIAWEIESVSGGEVHDLSVRESDNAILAIGSFNDELVFDSVAVTAPGGAGFVLELDSEGVVVGLSAITSTQDVKLSQSAVLDESVAIGGTFSGVATLDSGVLTSAGGTDALISLKRGVSAYSVALGGPANDELLSVALTASDETWALIHLGSATQVGLDVAGPGLTLIALDADLSPIMVKTFGGLESLNAPFHARLLPQAAGDVVVASTFEGTIDLGTESITAARSDWFLARLSANGDEVWSHRFGGAGLDVLSDAAQRGDTLAIVGGFSMSADFGGTAVDAHLSHDAGVIDDGFVSTYDANTGDVRWTRLVGGWDSDYLTSIAFLNDAIFVVGRLGLGPHATGVSLTPGPSAEFAALELKLTE